MTPRTSKEQTERNYVWKRIQKKTKKKTEAETEAEAEAQAEDDDQEEGKEKEGEKVEEESMGTRVYTCKYVHICMEGLVWCIRFAGLPTKFIFNSTRLY